MNANEPKAGHSLRISKGEFSAWLHRDGQADNGDLSEEGSPGQTEQGGGAGAKRCPRERRSGGGSGL